MKAAPTVILVRRHGNPRPIAMKAPPRHPLLPHAPNFPYHVCPEPVEGPSNPPPRHGAPGPWPDLRVNVAKCRRMSHFFIPPLGECRTLRVKNLTFLADSQLFWPISVHFHVRPTPIPVPPLSVTLVRRHGNSFPDRGPTALRAEGAPTVTPVRRHGNPCPAASVGAGAFRAGRARGSIGIRPRLPDHPVLAPRVPPRDRNLLRHLRWKSLLLIAGLVALAFTALAIQRIDTGPVGFERGTDEVLGLTLGLDLAGGTHLVYQAGDRGVPADRAADGRAGGQHPSAASIDWASPSPAFRSSATTASSSNSPASRTARRPSGSSARPRSWTSSSASASTASRNVPRRSPAASRTGPPASPALTSPALPAEPTPRPTNRSCCSS